ncbi:MULTISPECIES: hypothetical protein [Weeksella]|uniref:Uncharacterized protein n=1 Tax=Weeksella virosa (strain ATCC 43766 / DSM 16922 / JCM 21250 / CCUG 30538 / CDC 9751 / IAM 14551 / NBRC 16016 / NCTC 11634 / CL345/78) TaxID=865938 RepID=F0NXM6_WEEVC|nr:MULTISPECIES: hypothetical protein [Weeksella]ADX66933.1 hypothetical protein Weevi_0211 [Weeksella virosa DSM 16922]MDK7375719.1 hypothetical protein [Weeksella virosa]MDK7674920.1 hypothetical protein [Weeksella virosa]OFM84182.1 hypothetical protein HMPREF2660_09200 [Weeksella sp. HMSC059D05]SUP53248.1 Uncharacterised protein [Weeksella virosa]
MNYKALKISLLCILQLGLFSFYQSSYINWQENQFLTFENFKAKAPKGDKTAASIYTEISWVKKQTRQELPVYTVINRMDENRSWINRKDENLLNQKQLQFDISEFYTRKIRQEIQLLMQKKVRDEAAYKEVFTRHSIQLQRVQKKYLNLLSDQPYLWKIINKEYQDSLILYKDFSH